MRNVLADDSFRVCTAFQRELLFAEGRHLIEALIGLMGTPREVTGPINIGNPNEFTIRELAETVIELTRARSAIVYRTLPQDDPKQRQPDLTLANKTLGWLPRQSLKEGLVPTIQYFQKMLANEKLRQSLMAAGEVSPDASRAAE